ncbi:MAG: type II toxin-antitoxin system VapC family toxin [Gammaproteobacteria bacterium]|nr:type II toxin-antitoxin system VapC family toxin [Gammaproteobacteria bacterium]
MNNTPKLILDCSVTMAWCFEDEICTYTENALDSLRYATAIVPSIWPLEVANVLLVAERKKRLTDIDASRFKNLLLELPITIDHPFISRTLLSIYELAKKTGITSDDAAYLELALRKNIPLATLDQGLRQAAKKVGVLIWDVA